MKQRGTIGEYIKNYPADVRRRLRQIRETIREAAPDAAEAISYGIPTFKLNGKNLVHFAAFENHISLFPGASAVRAFKNELARFTASKGTVQFPQNGAIPYGLVQRMTRFRVRELKNKLLSR